MSAERHSGRQELAVLTRANHDMRSPLSVILGVFELLEDASSLTDGERRYLQLGMKAADELLMLADGLRLYSAMERNQVTLEGTSVDLQAMAREELEKALVGRDVRLDTADDPIGVKALGDEGYLKVALANLARYFASHLPKTSGPSPIALAVTQCIDEQGMVCLEVLPDSRGQVGGSEDPRAAADLEDELGVVNGTRLIELMGGRALASAAPGLRIVLPAAQGARSS